MFSKSTLTLAATCLVLATAAHANTAAVAWTDLNLRAGPGPAYPIIGVIAAGDPVDVAGCLDSNDWCSVTSNGTDGWASGSYLTGDKGTPIQLDRPGYAVKSVTYDNQKDDAAVAVGTAGAIIGAVVAGPVGAVVGAAIGAGTGAAVAPDSTVTTYVMANPVDPVYLDGEVVVGAGIPDGVMLKEVPDSTYDYAYVNGVPVLVERTTRRVTYILR